MVRLQGQLETVRKEAGERKEKMEAELILAKEAKVCVHRKLRDAMRARY